MTDHEIQYRYALELCCIRYEDMAEPGTPLFDFIIEMKEHIWTHPLLKLNRWLGYIQGTIISEGRTTVTRERDWTRPLFRPLDFEV